MSFGTKQNILNLRNMQLKFVLQKKKGISKDKVRKLLGFFATTRLVQDWKAAEPNKVLLKDCTWDLFLKKTLSEN